MRHTSILLHSLCFLIPPSVVFAQDQKILKSRLKDQVSVHLTVYSNSRSLVRDRRRITFEKGQLNLEIQDVSARMRPETAHFRNLNSQSDLNVLEQNFEFDLLSPEKLLEKYIGKKIAVVRTHPTNGTESSEPAEVLSVAGGTVLKMKDRIETGLPIRVSFPEVPPDLRPQPTLNLLLESKKKGEQYVELSYLSDGLSWKADYIAELNETENRMNLTGYVTLTNQSGTSFPNAQLQLMGGDIQTVENSRGDYLRSREKLMSMDMVAASPASSHPMQSESFFEYHLYSLPRPTTILSNQTKQISLLQANDVAARKEIVFSETADVFSNLEEDFDSAESTETAQGVDDADLGNPLKGGVFLVFENDRKSRLGMPLPAGIVRVYKQDKSSAAQFIGEDSIRHIPEEERVRVRLGSSFDVTARKKKMSFKNLPAPANLRKVIRVIEYSSKVIFRNAKDDEQDVVYRESLPGEAKILSSSRKHLLLGKNTVEWKLIVPAKGKLVLDYSIRANLRR